MTRFSRSILTVGVVIASIWTASAASAQAAPAASPAPAAVKSGSDSVSIRDIQKAADDLAAAVEAAVKKATEDPAVKVAALKVAKNAVTAAQVVITQQAQTLEAVLDALAKEIAIATDRQEAKAKKDR